MEELKKFDSKDIVSEDMNMDKYIESLVNKLREDKEVYESLKQFGFSMREVRSNIAKLADYQEDYNVCKKCPGIDKCPKTTPHISMYVFKDGNLITTRYEPCKKIIEETKFLNKFIYRDFPKEWLKRTMKDIDQQFNNNRIPLLVELASIIKGSSNRSIYVTGNHKVGKSYILALCACNFAKKTKQQVAVLDASIRFKELADLAFSSQEEFAAQIDCLCKIPLLVIDDFGQEYKNEIVRDQILLPILTKRFKQDLPTLIASEFTINEIQRLYGVGKNGGDIRAKQLGNILREMCDNEFNLTGVKFAKK